MSGQSDLARLRRCARILRRMRPYLRFRVEARWRSISQIGRWGSSGCTVELNQSLEAWEAYIFSRSEERP